MSPRSRRRPPSATSRSTSRRPGTLTQRPQPRSSRLARFALAGLALGLLTGPEASAATPGIELAVDRPSGRIAIERAGAGPLTESARSGPGPGGRIGFETASGWHHATRVAELSVGRRRTRLLLSTDDPAGREIELVGTVGRSGVVRLEARVTGGQSDDVLAVGIGFEARGRERYLGFGERSNAVDQRGATVESYVGEGPYQPGEYGVPAATLPPWAFHERADASYFPMPWLLSTRGYGVLVDNYETSLFRLETEAAGEWSVEVEAPSLRLRFFGGPRPADVVRQLTRHTGRQPRPAAPWQLGPWFQSGHQNQEPEETAYVEALRDADAPVSALETHMRYMPCGVDQGHEAEEAARAGAIHAAGLAAISYTREALCSSYTAAFDRAVAAGAFLEHPDGSPYTFTGFVGTGVTQIGMLDFSDPATDEVYASVLDRPYGNGFDGWMEDYGEYTPPDSLAANGMSGAEMHNYYPVLYHRAGSRYAAAQERPLVRFVRSGWTGVHPFAPIVWGGDPTTGWGFDGLESALTQALTMGLSGISTWGSDIGGFFTLSDQRLTEELLARWIQLGAVSGVMRTKAEGIGAAKEDRPQVWEQPTLAIWRRYAKLRTQLYPLLVAADRRYRRSGLPIMRHLALAFPDDRRARARDDEFLFAGRLLVAPVLEPGLIERRLYLPEGTWLDFWRTVSYRERDGGFELDRARVLRGGREVTVPAPLEQLPMLIKAGSLLPMLAPDVDTLAGYGEDEPGLVRLHDRRSRLRLLAFPRGHSRQRLYSDGVIVSREGDGAWRLRIDSPRRLTIELEASLAALEHDLRPVAGSADGRALRSWSFDRRSEVLEARLPAGTRELVVSSR